MKTLQEFVKGMHGISSADIFGSEEFKKLCSEAGKNDIVIIYGRSSKIIISGAIKAEAETHNGDIIRLTRNGIFSTDPYCEMKKCRYVELAKLHAAEIEICWKNGWYYKTDLPHEAFDITDQWNGNVCCRGIAIPLYDIPE